jgi:hypothetical protein
MNETRDLLRKGIEGFEPMPDAFERVLVRRDRKHRNERILVVAVTVAIALAGVAAWVGALRSGPTPLDRDIAPPNTRPVFQRTVTIGRAVEITSPSDWYLVDYWGRWNPDAVSLETDAIPLLELTNVDVGLSTPVCAAGPGGPTRLPADGIAIFVTVGSGTDVAELCGGRIEDSSTGTIGATPYTVVMTVGPDVTERDRAAAQEIWGSIEVTGSLAFNTRDRGAAYVLDGWQEGSSTWLFQARRLEGSIELSLLEISERGNGSSSLEISRTESIEGETFGAVTEAAERVELHHAGIAEPQIARPMDLPPSLRVGFDAYVFEPPPRGGPFEVLAIGADGEILGSTLPPLVDTEQVGTVRAFGTTWAVKLSTTADGFAGATCVEPAATSTLDSCDRGAGSGTVVQSFDEPTPAVFVTQGVGNGVEAIDVRSDDGGLYHAVMIPLGDGSVVAVIALEGGARGRFVYHLTDGTIDEGRRPAARVEWPDLGQAIGDGSFPPPDGATS